MLEGGGGFLLRPRWSFCTALSQMRWPGPLTLGWIWYARGSLVSGRAHRFWSGQSWIQVV